MKNLGLCQKACTGQSVYGHALNREILPLSLNKIRWTDFIDIGHHGVVSIEIQVAGKCKCCRLYIYTIWRSQQKNAAGLDSSQLIVFRLSSIWYLVPKTRYQGSELSIIIEIWWNNPFYYIHTEICALKRHEINSHSQASLRSGKPVQEAESQSNVTCHFFHIWRRLYMYRPTGATYHVSSCVNIGNPGSLCVTRDII